MFKRKASSDTFMAAIKATKRSKSVADVASSSDTILSTSASSLDKVKKRGGNKYLSKIKRLTAEQLLQSNALALCTVLNSCQEEEEQVGIALGRFFITRPEVLRLAVYCIGEEIRLTNDSALILRGSGVNTRVLSTLINLSGRAFLKRVLAPVIQTIIRENKGIEIDPTRVLPTEDVKDNLKNLTGVCNVIITTINSNLEHLPGVIAVIARELHDLVATKFPGSQYAAVGGLVVLRYIVPALTMPENFDLVKECSRDLRRKLIVIGKLLQAVYNGVLEQKEEWMQPLGKYVDKNKKTAKSLSGQLLVMAGGLNAKQFLRTLKEVTPTREEVKNSRSVLRNFCASNLKQLQEAVVLLKEDEDLSEPKLQAMIKAVQREEEVMKMKADDLRTSANALLGQFWTWTAQQSEKKVTLEETNEQFCQMVNMFDFEAATTATDDYNICVLNVKDERGTTTIIEMERDNFTIEGVSRRMKTEFSKIDKVLYEKDGNKAPLSKKVFQDFEGAGVIKGRKAVYRMSLIRKNSALDSYMGKI